MKNGKKNKETLGIGNINKFLEIFQFLNELGAHYLVVGGVAANLYGYSRSTKDIDLFIPKDIPNTEKVLEGLGNLTLGIAKELDAAEVTNKPFTIIGDWIRTDLVTIGRGIKFEDAYRRRKIFIINKTRIPVIALEDLIHLKKTGRKQDEVDIEKLRKIHKILNGSDR